VVKAQVDTVCIVDGKLTDCPELLNLLKE
jgi:hypothetical protein